MEDVLFKILFHRMERASIHPCHAVGGVVNCSVKGRDLDS